MKRPPLFNAWWYSAAGVRGGRATRFALLEAQWLWWRHREIRVSKVRADELRAKRERQGVT